MQYYVYILTNKNHTVLYTGVTRAKKLVVLVGSKKNIARMVYNNFIANRYSMLCEFIKKQSKMMDIMYSE